MKSLFFPFEQMVNYIEYLLNKRVTLTLVVLFTLIAFIFYLFDWKFLGVFIILSAVIFAIRKKDSKVKSKFNFFFIYVVVVFLGIIYGFTTKYYNEELDIISYFKFPNQFDHDTVNIYSAERNGNYHKIMDSIIVSEKKYFQAGQPESSGGYENPNRVLLDPNGVGFVQEDIYKEGDKIKEQINYVTPLYMEKLHILFHKKSPAFKNVIDIDGYLSIGYKDSSIIDAIINSRIAVGKTGTSTKILSSILLSEISKTKSTINVKEIQNDSLTGALAGIENHKKYDVIFFMAGQPVSKIKDKLLDTLSYGLIGIEPSFIDIINKSHNTQYRHTDFSVKGFSVKSKKKDLSYGSQYENLPTLGSYSYLIANKKVKPYLINEFIEALDKKKGNLNLDFVNFEDTHNSIFISKRNKTIASFLLAFAGGITLGSLMLSFIFALISSLSHDNINNRLARVIKNIPDDRIPINEESKAKKKLEDKDAFLKSLAGRTDEQKATELEKFEEYYELSVENKSVLKSPYIKFHQHILLNDDIIGGMSELVDLRREVNIALEEGRLNSEHFGDLLARIDNIMEKLRKSLFLRLNELLSREAKFGGIKISDECVTN